MDILKIKNLGKIYHTKDEEIIALEDFSLTLKKGEFVSIVGPSGCGKSTILSILSNLIDKSSGSIEIMNNISIGYMMQEDNLLDYRTIYKNCLLGLEIQNKNNELNKKYVLDLLKKYGLENFINSYPKNLSGGMRQRVALIRTLALKPDILLLDEAFSALDYQTRLKVSDDIYRIIKSENKSALMVTHDIAEAISMSDRVIVMSKRPGKIKSIYEINMKNKTTPINNRREPEFNKYYDLIWKDIDNHV